MAAEHFFVRLIPPRPTFVQDITESEQALMGQHADYMRRFFDVGKVLAYGPVLDPDGPFGFAVVEMEAEEVRRFIEEDPSVRGRLMRYTISPMRLAGAQASRR
jgi:uncharacterized protein YciI